MPKNCPLCYNLLDASSPTSHMLCPNCWAQMVFIHKPYCEVTGAPLPFSLGEGARSFEAIQYPPLYDKARCAFYYEGLGRTLILQMKFYDRPQLAHTVAGFMLQAGKELFDEMEMVLPVPLHRWRFLKRRFNQSAELARLIGKACQLPVHYDCLVRHTKTPHQVGLSRTERRRNLKAAFAVPTKKKHIITRRNVLLIDDVMTTGATIDFCAKTLKRAGANKVFALCAGKVVLT